MAATIPSVEPTSVQAGNSVSWTKSLSDYQASDSWALSYAARSITPTASVIDIAATTNANGDDFDITIVAATTALWVPAVYTLVGYVTRSPDRSEIYRGTLTVSPDISQITAEQGFDGRTYWEQVRDNLRTVIQNGVIRSAIRYSYNGVSHEVVTMKDAFEALAFVEARIAQEQMRGKSRKIKTRFRCPR